MKKKMTKKGNNETWIKLLRGLKLNREGMSVKDSRKIKVKKNILDKAFQRVKD